MTLLRTSIVVTFVTLLLVAGYAWNVADYGCSSEALENAGHCKHAPAHRSDGQSAPAGEDGLSCLCHQEFTSRDPDPIQVAPARELRTAFAPLVDEFAPESMPLGIDHPPQLG